MGMHCVFEAHTLKSTFKQREYFHRVIFNGCGYKNSVKANFIKVKFLEI